MNVLVLSTTEIIYDAETYQNITAITNSNNDDDDDDDSSSSSNEEFADQLSSANTALEQPSNDSNDDDDNVTSSNHPSHQNISCKNKKKKHSILSRPKFLTAFKNRLQIKSPPKIGPLDILSSRASSDIPSIDKVPSSSSSSFTISITDDEDFDNDTDDDDKNKKNKVVAFSTVETREYGVIVGDHPLCTEGPPLSLDWKYNPCTTLESVDERLYRENRETSCRQRRRRRRLRKLRRLNPKQRRERIFEVSGSTVVQTKRVENEQMTGQEEQDAYLNELAACDNNNNNDNGKNILIVNALDSIYNLCLDTLGIDLDYI